MPNDTSRWFQKPRILVPSVIVAVIIIAVAVVASGGKQADAPQESQKAPEAEKSAADLNKSSAADFVWHETPQPVAATVFKDGADADQTLAAFKGKVLVVNFWATWCAPCVKEMPMLDSLEAKLGGDSFQVVTISQDREGAKVAKPFSEKNGWKNLALYVEPLGKFSRDAQLRGLPTSLIVNKAGLEVARVEGEVDWNSPEIEKLIRDLLDKS